MIEKKNKSTKSINVKKNTTSKRLVSNKKTEDKETNVLYTIALVLGIVSVCMIFLIDVKLVCGVLAIIFSLISRKQGYKFKAPLVLGIIGFSIAFIEIAYLLNVIIHFINTINNALDSTNKVINDVMNVWNGFTDGFGNIYKGITSIFGK